MDVHNGALQVIDAHCHFGKFGPRLIMGRTIDPFLGRDLANSQALMDYLRKHGILSAVLVPMYTPDDPKHPFSLNMATLRCARQTQGVVLPGFWVDPSPGVRNELMTAIKEAEQHKVRILKMSPDVWEGDYSPDPASWDRALASGLGQIMEYAASTCCVLQVHTGSGKSDVRLVEKLIRWAPPGIAFHLVHMGGTTGGHFYLVPRLSEWAAEGLNVYCDTSLARAFAVQWLLRNAADTGTIADRILFASDEPWGVFETEVSKVTAGTVGDTYVRRRALHENARRLYLGER